MGQVWGPQAVLGGTFVISVAISASRIGGTFVISVAISTSCVGGTFVISVAISTRIGGTFVIFSTSSVGEMASADRTTLRDLRRTRQRRRLGEVEWFDVAYRVYLVALVGAITVIVASDATSGLLGDDVTTAQFVERAPVTLGIVAVAAVAVGLRGGAEGGPISIEPADVRHVLLAPIDRRTVMALPVTQRLRAVAFGGAVAGAVLGQLVARELGEARGGWAAAGALFGAVVGAAYVASAVIAHALRLPRWGATLIGAALLAWQCAAAWLVWDGSVDATVGPATLVGSLAMWGVRARGVDVVALVAIVVAVTAALALAGRLRVEQLTRRGDLVSQLRFAATMQDLRTVVLLRRQLRAESPRSRPWFGARIGARPVRSSKTVTRPRPSGGPAPASAVWRRATSSLRRLPAPRLGRMAVLAVGAGVAGSLTVSSSPLFGLALLAVLFLLGMEAIEPLAQEVDRPALTERLPVARGWLFDHLLVPPAAFLGVVSFFGVAGAAIVEPAHAAGAAALAIPVALAGATGPAVAAVQDAPPPRTTESTTLTGRPRGEESPFRPPEFAGLDLVVGAVVPLVLSAAGTAPVYAMRADASFATIARSSVGVVLLLAAVAWWIRRRDDWNLRIRAFFAEGRAAR